MILNPQKNFTIVRQIENHLDVDTNYVQAVIRNAYTDAIIDTIQLTSRGSQRFSKNWQVPADPSQQGFYVSIVTSVYTDAGYTSKNPNYGDQEDTYLVEDRLSHVGRGGGIDSYTVRRILTEELDKRQLTLDSVHGAIGAVQREVNRIPKELTPDRVDEVLSALRTLKPTPIDWEPLLEAVSQVRAAVEEKPVTNETDLAPLIDQLRSAEQNLSSIFLTREEQIASKVVETIRAEVLSQLHAIVKDTTFTLAPTTARLNPPKEAAPAAPVPFDPKQLAI